MKASIFLTSFFSMYCNGSKPRTSPAIRVEKFDASKRVIGPMPLHPAASAFQLASVPMPSGDTSPRPVTTTRRILFLGLGVRFDVLDGFLDARDLLRVLVGNLDAEFLFERHDELNSVERVGAEVVHERGVRRHFLFVDSELLHDDALHFVGYGHNILLSVAQPFRAADRGQA